jgi:oligosaccharide reducing-end xylanase
MSYGMMIAVQMDRQEEFDRLWKWAKTHMRHDSGPRRGWFSWHCARDGRRLSQNPASDGEEWIAMALFFAAHRWDAPSYLGEAQAILDAMLADRPGGEHELVPMFNREHAQIVFVPVGKAAAFTDPSYHLPAFYELWARWDDDAAERAFWMRATDTSRAFFRRAAHPATGLMPEYASFDGTPFTGFGEHRGDFRFDAWRTLANVALDHAWSGRDPWQVEQSNRVLRFLASQGEAFPDQYSLDGKPLSTDTSAGLVAMAAVAALAADRELAEPFVHRLWDAPVPDGHWRYYNGLLHMIGLLQVSGRFQIHEPR